MIQDEAIKCRYCRSDLTVAMTEAPVAGGSAPRLEPSPTVTSAPPAALPSAEPEMSSAGRAAALTESEAIPDRAPPSGRSDPSAAPGGPRIGEEAIRFSHTGFRYILGYGADFFGIWDRQLPGGPVERFPRTDQGWNAAWNRFVVMEPRSMAVPHRSVRAPDLRTTSFPFRRDRIRLLWTVGLLIASAALAVITVGVHIGVLATLYRARSQGFLSIGDRDSINDLTAVFYILDLLFLIPTAIAWCMWQNRAQWNLRALGVSNLRYSPAWVVGWWFVPFANIVMPFLTMRELWLGSQPEAGAVDWRMATTTPLLGLWWGAWLLYRYVLQGIAVNIPPDASVGGLMARSYVLIGAGVVAIAGAALAVVIVRRIHARQEAKSARTESWAASGG